VVGTADVISAGDNDAFKSLACSPVAREGQSMPHGRRPVSDEDLDVDALLIKDGDNWRVFGSRPALLGAGLARRFWGLVHL
jgi:hypothetical protein